MELTISFLIAFAIAIMEADMGAIIGVLFNYQAIHLRVGTRSWKRVLPRQPPCSGPCCILSKSQNNSASCSFFGILNSQTFYTESGECPS